MVTPGATETRGRNTDESRIQTREAPWITVHKGKRNREEAETAQPQPVTVARHRRITNSELRQTRSRDLPREDAVEIPTGEMRPAGDMELQQEAKFYRRFLRRVIRQARRTEAERRMNEETRFRMIYRTPEAKRRQRQDRKSTRLNSSHSQQSRMPSSA